jgi:hypothetical protein
MNMRRSGRNPFAFPFNSVNAHFVLVCDVKAVRIERSSSCVGHRATTHQALLTALHAMAAAGPKPGTDGWRMWKNR